MSQVSGGGIRPEGERRKIAFFNAGTDNTYLHAAVVGAIEAADDRGVELDVFSGEWNADKQIEQLQSSGFGIQYDGLVIGPVDNIKLGPIVAEAAKRMVVSVFNVPIGGDYVNPCAPNTIGYFGRDYHACGRLLVEQMALALNGKGKVGLISPSRRRPQFKLITDRIKETLPKYPGLELIADMDGTRPATIHVLARELLRDHPDVNGIIFGYEPWGAVVIEGLHAEKKLDGVKIVTYGGTREGFDLIKRGIIFSAVNALPKSEAANAVIATIDVLEGKPISVPGFDPVRKVYSVYEDPFIPGIVNKDNVGPLKAQWTTW
jgi:ribose transport system substrate-binding protein